MYPELKENRPHGTDNYPYTQYHMHNIFHAFQIPVHWHDELEVIYTKKGPLNLLIDGKEYTAEDGSVYFVAPGQLHLIGSRGCRLLHPPVSSRIYFVSVG